MRVADRRSFRGQARVLVTSAFFEPGFRGGGPVRSLAQIVDSAPNTIDITLVTQDRDLGLSEPYPRLSGTWVPRKRSQVYYLNTHSVRQWMHLAGKLRKMHFDLLYVNSLWAPTFTVLPILAAALRLIHVRRILIAPRGELSRGALSLKQKKKQLFLQAWRPILNRLAVTWHASTDLEAAEIARLFPRAPITVWVDQAALSPAIPLASSGHEGPARFVFVSRISPKKNLDLVLNAFKRVTRSAIFDIYGPIEDAAYWSWCKAVMSQLPRCVEVRYRGELEPHRVRPCISNYDAFVFPTRWENFGHVIAESLSVSCPVICSRETPWTDVLEAGGGEVLTQVNVYELSEILERFAAMNSDERVANRHRVSKAFAAWHAGGGVVRGSIFDDVLLARDWTMA
jgi:glycosyltransferase involved in cell wall biosynthesis